MSKRLKDMTLEELWELFPIVLTPHNPQWAIWAKEEMLPVGNKLIKYDSIAVNTIVANSQGEVSSCDIPYSEDLSRFNDYYLRLTRQVAETCENHDITDSMVIGTSA